VTYSGIGNEGLFGGEGLHLVMDGKTHPQQNSLSVI